MSDDKAVLEAIQHCEDVACRVGSRCSRDHTQLAAWLRELLELRRLTGGKR